MSGGPSNRAVAAAAPEVELIADGRIRTDEQAAREARDVLDLAHSRTLGNDRSVCLRDVLSLLRDPRNWPHELRARNERDALPIQADVAHAVADLLEDVFGERNPSREAGRQQREGDSTP